MHLSQNPAGIAGLATYPPANDPAFRVRSINSVSNSGCRMENRALFFLCVIASPPTHNETVVKMEVNRMFEDARETRCRAEILCTILSMALRIQRLLVSLIQEKLSSLRQRLEQFVLVTDRVYRSNIRMQYNFHFNSTLSPYVYSLSIRRLRFKFV